MQYNTTTLATSPHPSFPVPSYIHTYIYTGRVYTAQRVQSRVCNSTNGADLVCDDLYYYYITTLLLFPCLCVCASGRFSFFHVTPTVSLSAFNRFLLLLLHSGNCVTGDLYLLRLFFFFSFASSRLISYLAFWTILFEHLPGQPRVLFSFSLPCLFRSQYFTFFPPFFSLVRLGWFGCRHSRGNLG